MVKSIAEVLPTVCPCSAGLQIVGCKTLYLGSFYRPPDITDPEYLDQLNSSLKRIMAYKISQVLIGRDLYCGDIDWNKLYVPLGMPLEETGGGDRCNPI